MFTVFPLTNETAGEETAFYANGTAQVASQPCSPSVEVLQRAACLSRAVCMVCMVCMAWPEARRRSQLQRPDMHGERRESLLQTDKEYQTDNTSQGSDIGASFFRQPLLQKQWGYIDALQGTLCATRGVQADARAWNSQ